jgi:hypothetical protein
MVRCVECDELFDPTQPGTGRPRKICSGGCRKHRRNRQQLRWRKSRTCPQYLHGSISGYGTYGCRCENCREANTVYTREKRAKQRGIRSTERWF